MQRWPRFSNRRWAGVTLVWIAALLASCSASRSDLAPDDGVIFVASEDAQYPLLRYRDGQLSGNTSCMIQLANPISRRIPPMYVNGRPLGFC